MDLRNQPDWKTRNRELEADCHISLRAIADTFADDIDDTHCENLIGSVSIPVGVAGPIEVRGEHCTGSHYVPLSTTEGALVASVHRGCKAISLSGGVYVHVEKVGTTRGPIFQAKNSKEAFCFGEWLQTSKEQIANVAKETSAHLSLIACEHEIQGKNIYVRFAFDTDQAMGMNMVTIATQKIVEFITTTHPVTCIAIAGNYDSDKKPSWSTFSKGRGRKGWADVTLSASIVQDVLKTTPQAIVDVVQAKCIEGSIAVGALGYNAHYANIVAALYVATGQDLANVVEGSHGITQAAVEPDGSLYFAVKVPAIMVGSVGGGTKLRTQKEARSITKCETSDEFAELVVAAVCAGELSLLAALASHTLSQAHKRLGR